MYFLAAVVEKWESDLYPVLRIILLVLMVVIGLVIIACVLLQKGNSEGLGAISGGSDTFFGQNKGKTLDGKLKKVTIGCGIAVVIISILFFITVIRFPVGAQTASQIVSLLF